MSIRAGDAAAPPAFQCIRLRAKDSRLTTRVLRLTLAAAILPVALLCLFTPFARVRAGAPPDPIPDAPTGYCEADGVQPSGAIYRICMPNLLWNGDLVVYAHGYVAYNVPLVIPENQLSLPNGISLPSLVNALGYAFAVTSYRTNGLAVKDGVDDLVELVDVFTAKHGRPNRVYVTGVSEGGLIATLAVERRPDVFDGGLAACGPLGDFRRQIDYFGDFRVLFDYFFPGLMPGDPTRIPQSLIDNWDAYVEDVIQPALLAPANAAQIDQLFRVSGAPRDPNDPASVITSTIDALSYNVLATNDGVAKLGGQPFDNRQRVYAGSDDDARLNQMVARFDADPGALAGIAADYQTTGRLTIPLVTMHTTLDQQVPYWHMPSFRGKVIANDAMALHRHFEIDRYGHCYFEFGDVLNAFLNLLSMVYFPPAPIPSQHAYLPIIGRGP